MNTHKLVGLMLGLTFASSALAAAPDLKAGEELAKKNACMTCHTVDKKVVGPSYKDVAAKYKGDNGAIEKLVGKVKKGGKGVWGEVAMPPQATVNDGDLKSIVAWILSLK